MPYAPREDGYTSPFREASHLVPLLKLHSLESVRRLIANGNDPHRRRVRHAFDVLVYRRTGDITRELATEIIIMLRTRSIWRVAATFHLPVGVIQKIARQAHPTTVFEKSKRGRRFSAEELARIKAFIATNPRTIDAVRALGICSSKVQSIRRELGLGDRRHHLRFPQTQLEGAKDLLLAGTTWLDAARSIGCSLPTLIKRVKFRKGCRRILPLSVREAIAADSQAGLSQAVIAKKLHVHGRVVSRIQRELGLCRTHRKFTVDELRLMQDGFARGETNQVIARKLRCRTRAVWWYRKREGTNDGQ